MEENSSGAGDHHKLPTPTAKHTFGSAFSNIRKNPTMNTKKLHPEQRGKLAGPCRFSSLARTIKAQTGTGRYQPHGVTHHVATIVVKLLQHKTDHTTASLYLNPGMSEKAAIYFFTYFFMLPLAFREVSLDLTQRSLTSCSRARSPRQGQPYRWVQRNEPTTLLHKQHA